MKKVVYVKCERILSTTLHVYVDYYCCKLQLEQVAFSKVKKHEKRYWIITELDVLIITSSFVIDGKSTFLTFVTYFSRIDEDLLVLSRHFYARRLKRSWDAKFYDLLT